MCEKKCLNQLNNIDGDTFKKVKKKKKKKKKKHERDLQEMRWRQGNHHEQPKV